ncbi:MAG: hypothetical protein HYZ75_13365 [Elusimicrobia bacterium]|nr:hypothetical protein [Elusimicrobiota bacterium]
MSAVVLAAALSTGTLFQTSGFSAPESALWDPEARVFYVSNMAGTLTAKDGSGWVAKLSEDGRLLAPRWVGGFHSPKGLALSRGRLYVADIDQVAVIDPASGKVERRILVPGAVFLNDAAEAPDGSVYLSDTAVGAIFRLAPDGSVEEWARGDRLEGPNGLKVRGGRLYVAAWGIPAADFSTKVPGRVYWLDLKTKQRFDVSPVPLGNLDGLEPASGGGWLTTDLAAGKLWRVAEKDGSAVLIKEGLKGPADLGYDPRRRLIVVPQTGADVVIGLDQDKLP